MQPLSLVATLVLAASTTGTEGWVPSAKPPLPEPIFTRQTLFSIPFQVDPPRRPEEEPVEVQLYVSADRGATWHFYSKVEPKRGYFLFRAGGDGEFWFHIRTLDRAGILRPEEITRPGLRVLVDTAPPRLDLKAERDPAGRVTVDWQVEDANFDLERLRLQYRTAASPMWQFVAVDRQHFRSEGPVHHGQVTWWAPPDAARIEIRCEVADAADNPTVSHAQLAGDVSPSTAPAVAGSPVLPPAAAGQIAAAAGQIAAAATAERSYAFPAASDPGRPSPYGSYNASNAGGFAAAAMPARPETPPDTTASDLPDTDGPVAIQFYPPIRNQYVPYHGSSIRFDTSVVPQGEPLRMVCSKVFEIEYDVASVGPTGVAGVELWGTRDGGRTWSSFGIDDDNRSPLLVTVHEEGIYGFRVAVQNRSGLGGKKPLAGDKPDVWIAVDQTEPKARLLDTQQGGDRAGQLLIRWEADDALPAERPISLYFSRFAGGPWLAIAKDLENSGEYLWSIENQASGQIWLRLEVRDRAGNLGVSETAAAISLDELQPVVRIRDVRPLDHAVQTPARRYFFR